MIVLVLTACPEGLRGHHTRWLMEISAGVFVGHASTRVQDEIWGRTVELIGRGRALMVVSAATEQRFAVRSHGHHWTPEDVEGLTLMRRPGDAAAPAAEQQGWSVASRRARARRK